MHPRLEVRRAHVAASRAPSPEQVRDALGRADQLLAAEAARREGRRAQRRVRRVFWLALGMAVTAGCAALMERLS